MGYRKRYNNPKIVKYTQTPSGKKLENKFAIIDGLTLLSSASGLTKTQAKKQLPYYKKSKKYVFTRGK